MIRLCFTHPFPERKLVPLGAQARGAFCACPRKNLSVTPAACHCPGCGSQRLLRCRLHPAGRCMAALGRRACPLRLLRSHLSQGERLSLAVKFRVFILNPPVSPARGPAPAAWRRSSSRGTFYSPPRRWCPAAAAFRRWRRGRGRGWRSWPRR